MIQYNLSPKELISLWIVLLILIIGTNLNAIPTLNSANAEAPTIDNNSTMVKSITNSLNTTDSEDKEDVNESEKEEEEDNDIEEEDD